MDIAFNGLVLSEPALAAINKIFYEIAGRRPMDKSLHQEERSTMLIPWGSSVDVMVESSAVGARTWARCSVSIRGDVT